MAVYKSQDYTPDAHIDAEDCEQLAFMEAMLNMYAAYRKMVISKLPFVPPSNVRVEVQHEGPSVRVLLYTGDRLPKRGGTDAAV